MHIQTSTIFVLSIKGMFRKRQKTNETRKKISDEKHASSEEQTISKEIHYIK
jgi:hypothetical protein